MNDSGGNAVEPVTPRRRFGALLCLMALHLAPLGAGWWLIAEADGGTFLLLLFAQLAAIVSLLSIWLALGELSLGTRCTIVLATFTSIGCGMILFIGSIEFVGAFLGVLFATYLGAMFLAHGVLLTLALAWLGRRNNWVLSRSGAAVRRTVARTKSQFGVQHIVLWTVMVAVALAGLRTLTWDDWPDYAWSDTTEMLLPVLFCVTLGLIQSGTALVTFVCLGRRPRWKRVMLAIALAGIFTALSVAWSILWFGTSDGDVWSISLLTAVHFVLLSASIGLLRLAGYQFTRRADTPAEATPP